MSVIHLEAQMTQSAAMTLDDGATFVFDHVIEQTPTIGYDPATGMVTFLAPGVYVVECVISTNALGSYSAIVTGIHSSALDGAIQLNSLQKSAQTHNSTIVNVPDFPDGNAPQPTLFITNDSGGNVRMSHLETQGTLIIYSIEDDTRVTGSAEVTGAAGSTGSAGVADPTGVAVVPEYSSMDAHNYVSGQLVNYHEGVYIVTVASPTGTPDSSSDYIPMCKPPQLLYTQMQLTGKGNEELQSGEIIVFNHTVSDRNPNVTYNNITGEFTLAAAGNYEISMWGSVDAYLLLPDAFILELIVDGNVISAAGMTFNQGVAFVSDSAVVETTTEAVTVAIRNAVNSDFLWVDGPAQAGILIKQIV